LAAAGAQLAAVASMGGHFCIGELESMSPLRMLNAIPEVDAAIRRRGLKTVGILGTRMVMETGLYGGISSAQIVVPEGEALEQVHQSYIGMAIAGRVTDAQRRTFFSIGERLHRVQGGEAVLLGGTDLFLAFEGQDWGFPVMDCAEMHVDAPIPTLGREVSWTEAASRPAAVAQRASTPATMSPAHSSPTSRPSRGWPKRRSLRPEVTIPFDQYTIPGTYVFPEAIRAKWSYQHNKHT
jgi:aspartate/glutamate racemase